MDNIPENKPLEPILTNLVKTLNLTKPDEDEVLYVLTKEEEEKIIAYEINQAKIFYAWRLRNYGTSEEEILSKIAQVDNWEEIVNVPEVLKKANLAKEQEMWHKKQSEERKNQEKKQKEELLKRCNANYMYNVMAQSSFKNYDRKLIVHEDNRPLIKALCFFFSRDPRFESELGYSFRKGLCVRGKAGVGKTHLIRCLEHNELSPICINSMIDITNSIHASGEYKMEMEGKQIIYLDDVGTEEVMVNYYGTRIFYFKNFIETYYINFKEYDRLIISTNCSFDTIENLYGFRVRSRMKDMFNVIDVSGADMRGL